ncbi:MAG: carboxypeptidase-like regulatory domain-containing protein [Bacteroidia bacterium]
MNLFKTPYFIILLLLVIIHGASYGQSNPVSDKSLIQFSGVVVSADSLQPIPFTNVIIRNARRGTITDFYGFFSFVAMKGDTIDFQYVGFKTSSYLIPDSLDEQHYSIIQVLVRDTINLKEAIVYPWPTKEEFKRAFIALKLSDDDLKRAQRNFELASLKEVQAQVLYDGGLNYQMALQQRQTQLYSQGQFPSITLLNPLAWAAFIQSWKDGAYKKKEKE